MNFSFYWVGLSLTIYHLFLSILVWYTYSYFKYKLIYYLGNCVTINSFPLILSYNIIQHMELVSLQFHFLLYCLSYYVLHMIDISYILTKKSFNHFLFSPLCLMLLLTFLPILIEQLFSNNPDFYLWNCCGAVYEPIFFFKPLYSSLCTHLFVPSVRL